MRITGGVEENGVVVGNAYDKYNSQNPIVRYLMEGFETSLHSLVKKTGVRDIYGVGCGEGYWTLRWLKEGCQARGSDFHASDRVGAHERWGIHQATFSTGRKMVHQIDREAVRYCGCFVPNTMDHDSCKTAVLNATDSTVRLFKRIGLKSVGRLLMMSGLAYVGLRLWNYRHSFTWAVGFIVPAAPAGLSVRKAVLVAVLSEALSRKFGVNVCPLVPSGNHPRRYLFFLKAILFGRPLLMI